MRISYFLEDTAISGTARTILAQADALVARGHAVRLVTKAAPLTWRTTRAEWVYLDDFGEHDAEHDDFVIAATWAAVEDAYDVAGDRAVHLCRGYEGALPANIWARNDIDRVFALPIAKLVTSKAWLPSVQEFSDDVTFVGEIVDDDCYRDRLPREHEPLRVLLCGASADEVKGIDDGYGAIAHARWFHQKIDFVRVSPWAPSRDEPVEAVQEFHVALSTAEMTRVMHSCDIFVAPNRAGEGFGLAAAEALASGLPAALTSIPSFGAWDEQGDFALFAPEDNAVELGERLIELLGDAGLRDRIRTRGRQVARQWRAEESVARLEGFFAARAKS